MDARRVTLGRVAGVFGVKGWIKLHSFTRPPENILKYRSWWLTAREPYEAKLVAGQAQNRSLVAQITDAAGQVIDDRDVAMSLLGAEIQVERAAMPSLARGEIYWADLLGLRVENLDGMALGTVTDVTSNGAQDVLVIADGKVERLIPFVRGPIVHEVDVDAGRIICDWQPDY